MNYSHIKLRDCNKKKKKLIALQYWPSSTPYLSQRASMPTIHKTYLFCNITLELGLESCVDFHRTPKLANNLLSNQDLSILQKLEQSQHRPFLDLDQK